MEASGPCQPCLEEMPAMNWFLIRCYLQRGAGWELGEFHVVNTDLAPGEGRG